jgi:hypothetical protein
MPRRCQEGCAAGLRHLPNYGLPWHKYERNPKREIPIIHPNADKIRIRIGGGGVASLAWARMGSHGLSYLVPELTPIKGSGSVQ